MKSFFKTASIIFGFLGAIYLSSCGTGTQNSTSNVHGIDRANFDTTCSPCLDFYQYANGKWVENNPIPAEYSAWTVFHEIYERNGIIIREILEESAENTSAGKGSISQQVGDFYFAGMDTNRIEELGFSPLQDDFNRIDAMQSGTDVTAIISEYHGKGLALLFDVGSDQDMMDNTQVILYATQGGISLPEKDYYLKDDAESVELRNKYQKHVAKMFMLTGDDEATSSKRADNVLTMETRLAEASLSALELRNPMSWYNIQTTKEVAALSSNFGWDAYLKAVGLDNVTSFSYAHPKFFAEMNSMIDEVAIDSWKDYLKWHILTGSARYLSSEFVNEDFVFFSNTIYGTEELRPRWKRMMSTSNRMIGEPLGQLYIERAFPPESKAKALDMVENLRWALGERIAKLPWMSDQTKEKALIKLAAFTPKIGYPDKWHDYTSLEINRDSFLDNIENARAFSTRMDLDKIGKPVDKTEWGMNPQDVNAYYNPLMNEVVFPAGILQPPYFDAEIDDAVNYGAMGVIIGHEMTHGFDDEGRKFDAIGNFNDWWTEEDATEFEKRTALLIKQFDDFIAVDSLHVNGALTLGENIADLGGLTVSYYALQKALEGNSNNPVDGFTPEQRFFLSYAQAWRNNSRPEDIRTQVLTDPHSPGYFRAIGPVANMNEFREAFDCKEWDVMVRTGEDQITIW